MTGREAITTLGLLIAEINRHQGAIGDILELALQESRSETALEEERRATEEDNGSCHGHPGAPRRCTTPVPSPYNAATGGVTERRHEA